MEELIPHLVNHFDGLQDRLACFCEQGVQVEGWFKGELLALLSELRRNASVERFDREVKIEAGRVDITAHLGGKCHWVELKHWHIGKQGGTSYGPAFYFCDRELGILRDVDKLRNIDSHGHGWLLLLLTANPGEDAWLRGLARFHEKFAPRVLTSRTSPSQFPSTYFLGLLEVASETSGKS